ncbi:site-specific DNA-methyltransferase [Paenibacillus sp. FSL E2-0151]|uniref:DNA-methyltransferase n=1 Tax=Paenibacillus sp. FSL E2-0151 TaxID=2921357 RepID=UPI0030ED98D9
MIITGNCIEVMPDLEAESFHTCVTSPPYWGLRDYGLEPSYWPETTYTPMPGLSPIAVPEWTGCLGLEPTPEMFVAHTLQVFREVWRLLRPAGTLWMNFGDSYAKAGVSGLGDPTIGERNLGGMKEIDRKIPPGLKPKDMVGIPWRVAFALQADGWYLRMDNIWHKPNPMPESVRDRPTKAHEYFFLLSKSDRYYYDAESIFEAVSPNTHARLSQDVMNQIGSARANGGAKTNGNMKAVGRKPKASKPGSGIKYNESYESALSLPVTQRNKRSVWSVTTQGFSEAHFATFPEKLIEPCILAGAPVGGRVLDPFGGSGTTLKVAHENNRECTIIEMGPHNVEIAERRTAVVQPTLIF